jgi:hypothetical protein
VGAIPNGTFSYRSVIGPGTHAGSGTSADFATGWDSNFSLEIYSVTSTNNGSMADTYENGDFGDNDSIPNFPLDFGNEPGEHGGY